MTSFYPLNAVFSPAKSILARGLAFPLFLLGAGLMFMQPCAGAPSQFEETGSLATARSYHTETLLPDGKVLVTGGIGKDGSYLASAEVYDPASGTWTATGNLATKRGEHTATLLPDGKVLVAGGRGAEFVFLATAEVYDPANGIWTPAGSLTTARRDHTATLLPNGKVLVAGGGNLVNGALSSAELYDPVSGTWAITGSLSFDHEGHTATLLPNGKVLVAGGYGAPQNAELYDPASGTWTLTGNLVAQRAGHTATLLPGGKVLVAGGGYVSYLNTAELYDPASGTWTPTGSLATARDSHTATLLPEGDVLVAAGQNFINGSLTSAELYDPASGSWTAADSLAHARHAHTATLLLNGKVLVAGGTDGTGPPPADVDGSLASAEIYGATRVSWTATDSLDVARYNHTATLVPNGKVLVAGGSGSSGPISAVAELYDPVSETWTTTGTLATARYNHTATLLPDGKVLVAGGQVGGDFFASVELYNPASGTWTTTGSLVAGRCNHTATLLPNGQVLVAGGFNGTGTLASAELYDPASGTWTTTGSLTNARELHTATSLSDGKVLVAGGTYFDFESSTALTSAEVYDSVTGTWTTTGSLLTACYNHTTTLLPNGKVLVAGGLNNTGALASAQLYDSAMGTWTTTGSLTNARFAHTATLLSNGDVLVAGGAAGSAYLTSAELYDPANGGWVPTDSLITGRDLHTATLLENNQVLVAGGYGSNKAALASAELYGTAIIRPLLNISTRLNVGTGDNVLIGGFIVGGTVPKKVILRAIGPSLADLGELDTLADPILELHEADGTIVTNDNWRDTQEQEIIDSTLQPTNNLEAAIVATLDPGAYTAIVRGKDDGTGIGLVEAYDLDQAVGSQLANISTRGFVDTGDNVMIGGFIVGGESNPTILVRAIGPSLGDAGVTDPLQDPTLELHDSEGVQIAFNDDWKDSQEAEIEATTIPPTDDREAAILSDLAPGAYTAIVRGKAGTTGVGLVEVYNLQ